jgi:hypothetical protein
VLGLGESTARIAEGAPADLAVFTERGMTPAATLMGAAGEGPQIVIRAGKLVLVSAHFAERYPELRGGLHPLHLEGRGKFFVAADVRRLYSQATKALGAEIRLGGKQVLV